MRMKLLLWAMSICLLGFTCSQVADSSEADQEIAQTQKPLGQTQIISEGMPGEMKEVGFTKFDGQGRKLAYKFLNTHFRYEYNANDSLEKVFDLSKEGEESLHQVNTFDSAGRLQNEKFYASGNVITLENAYEYDANGSLKKKTSDSKYSGRKEIEFFYEKGKLTKEIRQSNSDVPLWVFYTYNSKGQVEKKDFRPVDERQTGYSETFFYDPNGRLGNKVERSGPDLAISYNRFWQYDTRGNVVQESCAPEDHQGCNGKIDFEWNADGDVVSKKEYADGQLILQTTYRYEVSQ